MTRKLKISICSNEGELLDYATIQVDSKIQYFSLKSMEDSFNPECDITLNVGLLPEDASPQS
jgi:hypothetical protein